MFLKYIASIFICISCAHLSAQELIHYTQDNGLPSNKVYMTTTDSRGYIWCTTNKGIAMFNGEKFKTYSTQEGLPVNDLWKIYADDKGRVWYFGRSSELGYIENGIVYRFPSNDRSVINPTNFSIQDNDIGLIGSGGGYWLEDGYWKFYPFENKFVDFLNSNSESPICHLYADTKNNFVISISTTSLTQLDTNFHVIFESSHIGSKIVAQTASPSMLMVGKDFFYYMLADRLICYDVVKRKIILILLQPYFPADVLNELHLHYSKGNVFINGPAGRYIMKNDSLQLSVPPVPVENVRPSGFYTDNLNNTWISTPNDGLYMYAMYNKQKRLLNGENVQHLETFKNKIYLAVENNGLFYYEDGLIAQMPIDGKYFYELESLGDSVLKYITNKEIGLYNGSDIIHPAFDGEFFNVTAQIFYKPLIGNFKALYIENKVYYFTTGGAFAVYDKIKNSIYVSPGIYHIVKYRKRILLGSTTGVKIFNGLSLKQVPVYTTTQVNKLMVMGDYLLVATEGQGLFAYNSNLNVVPGTESFFVNNIRKLNDSTAWISTTIGLHEIKLSNGDFKIARSVLKSNGLPSDFVNDVLIINDSMYCATNNGLCILDMKELKLKADPEIVITSISANDSMFDSRKPIEVRNRGYNSISINFDISFLHEHKQLRNYYQLEPVQNNWTPLTSNTLVLNGLKPGKYKIRIRSEGFNQNVDEKIIELRIRPRWYETTVFWVIAIGWILIFLFVIISYTVSSTVRKRDRKHQLETKLVNLELDALRSKLNPHFIFNTFNSIQLFINNNEMELSEKYLILLSKHIRNVFEFSHLQNITLEKEISLLKDYLEIEKIRFGDKINIQIEVDPKIDIHHTLIPSMMIQPFVENTMVHGLFHKKGVGNLLLKFSFISDSVFQVQIIDDGVGFVEKPSERISSTKVITERVALINQSDEFNVNIQKSYLNETGENKGTIITITVKHGK